MIVYRSTAWSGHAYLFFWAACNFNTLSYFTSIIISSRACFQRDNDRVARRAVRPNRTTWSERLAFPECCRLCLQGGSTGTEPAEGEEVRGGRGREGEVASPERAGTCPVLKVCHPQLEQRAQQRKKKNNRDKVVLIVCWRMWAGWTRSELLKYQSSKYVKYAHL